MNLGGDHRKILRAAFPLPETAGDFHGLISALDKADAPAERAAESRSGLFARLKRTATGRHV